MLKNIQWLVAVALLCRIDLASSTYLYAVGSYVGRNVKMSATTLHSGQGNPIANVTWISEQMSYDFNVMESQSTSMSLSETAAATPFFFESSDPLVVQILIQKGPSNTAAYQAPLITNTSTMFINDEISRHVRRGQGITVICASYSTSVTVLYNNGRMEALKCDKFGKLVLEGKGDDNLPVKVISSNPVAAFSFHDCAQVPKFPGSCDALISGLTPVDDLDLAYVLPPVGGRMGDVGYTVQVTSAEDNTRVVIQFDETRQVHVLREALEYVQFNVTPNVASLINCSKPCLVKQYNNGQSIEGVVPDHLTDGYSLEIIGTKDYSSTLTFIPGSNETYVNYLSIVAYAVGLEPEYVLDLSDHEIFIPWAPVPGMPHHSTVVVKVDTLIQVTILSKFKRMRLAGYLSAHHFTANTAYGLLVAVKGLGNEPIMQNGSQKKTMSSVALCCICFILSLLVILKRK